MELYYNIVKNVYKTYTKRINSVYKFLIGNMLFTILPLLLLYSELSEDDSSYLDLFFQNIMLTPH